MNSAHHFQAHWATRLVEKIPPTSLQTHRFHRQLLAMRNICNDSGGIPVQLVPNDVVCELEGKSTFGYGRWIYRVSLWGASAILQSVTSRRSSFGRQSPWVHSTRQRLVDLEHISHLCQKRAAVLSLTEVTTNLERSAIGERWSRSVSVT